MLAETSQGGTTAGQIAGPEIGPADVPRCGGSAIKCERGRCAGERGHLEVRKLWTSSPHFLDHMHPLKSKEKRRCRYADQEVTIGITRGYAAFPYTAPSCKTYHNKLLLLCS